MGAGQFLYSVRAMSLVDRVRKAAVPVLIVGTIFSTSVLGACDWGNTPTIVNPPADENHVSNNSYDFAESLGLDADYLRELNFDDNARDFITYLSSLPTQMRNIAEDSGLTEKLINDKQITINEAEYFKRLIGSYQTEIETMQPWLNQLSEQDSLEALALNLSNFLKVNKDEMFYNLDSDVLPSLLPRALFTADGVERKYATEVIEPDAWEEGWLKPYALAMVQNIKNFDGTHDRAWYIANHPDYKPTSRDYSMEDLLTNHIRANAIVSIDNGQNAIDDISLLLEQGSDVVKAWLRLYASNLGRGNHSSAEQARVELTEIDSWSVGIPVYEMMISGHDVPAGPLTQEDIELLKSRSNEPLLIIPSPYDGSPTINVQWTRKSIIKEDVRNEPILVLYPPKSGGNELYLSELKEY